MPLEVSRDNKHDDSDSVANPLKMAGEVSHSASDSAGNAGDNDNFKEPKLIALNETVGNMSISPANRDLALAARNGLYIVDLENTRATPRFLPQGGTWEVADVQWNPHPSSGELIVSASNQKLLIWNLRLRGPTSIQHILHGHFRAVTDINWHPIHDSVVASTSIDGWTMIWDVRDRNKKDVMRMTTWNDSGTQVKWNRKSPHILASAHRGHVQIWDDRKGAVPLTTVYAHHSKIYGIDWSRTSADELVTCSLDASIRRFSVSDRFISPDTSLSDPLSIIQTALPVWRARHLPFGHGVLSLPQRGSFTLEMYKFTGGEEGRKGEGRVVQEFERTALVKEYVWRTRGGDDLSFDDREFQLITLATDRTVKMEYIPPAVLESTGHVRGSPIKVVMSRRGGKSITYRDPPPPQSEYDNALLDDRLVTASTRRTVVAPADPSASVLLNTPYQRYVRTFTPSSSPGQTTTPGAGPSDVTNTTGVSNQTTSTIPATAFPPQPARRVMTLAPKKRSKANKRRGVDQLAWFNSVTVDRDRDRDRDRSMAPTDLTSDDEEDEYRYDYSQAEGDSATVATNTNTNSNSNANGGSLSRSRSRPTSRTPSQSGWSARSASGNGGTAAAGTGTGTRSASRLRSKSRITPSERGGQRSRSGSPLPDDERDSEPPQDLAEEVSRVVRRLSGKVQHEKTETASKLKRCTFTLHGPWGGTHSAPTFIRVTFFNFPSYYPRPAPFSRLANKTRPSVEIEKGSTDLPDRTRHTLMRNLRKILAKESPALELCLLYLLGRYEIPPEGGIDVSTWGGVDDDDDGGSFMPGASGDKHLPIALLIDHQTLPRGKHTQAVFGPTGQLVYLSRRTVRAVSTPARGPSPTESMDSRFDADIVPSTSGTLLDAMWGLSKLSTDAAFIKRDYVDIGRPRRANFTDGIIMSPYVRSRTREALPPPPPLTDVRLFDATALGATADPSLAVAYKLIIKDLSSYCSDNALVAAEVERQDHVQVWRILDSVIGRVLVPVSTGIDDTAPAKTAITRLKSRALAQRDLVIICRAIYNDYLVRKDVQMLAMLAVLILNLEEVLPKHTSLSQRPAPRSDPSAGQHFPTLRLHIDYHSHRLAVPAVYAPAPKASTPRASQQTPQTAQPSPPTPSSGPSSSKASWSSILSAASYRNLLGSSGSKKGWKGQSPSDSKRISTVDELALANGSITPEVAAVIADLRRRRAVKMTEPSSKTVDFSAGSMHTKTRSDSFHSQPQPMRINHSATLPAFRRRVPSMNHAPTPRVPSKPVKIQANFHDPPIKELVLLTPELRIQCEGHIRAYAEVLRQLGLRTQRAEVLKHARVWDVDREENLTMISLCKMCGRTSHPRGVKCRSNRTVGGTLEPRCSICSLPVKRLGRTCLRCTHVTHLSCLGKLPVKIRRLCPTGCGCHCGTLGGSFEVDKNPLKRENRRVPRGLHAQAR